MLSGREPVIILFVISTLYLIPLCYYLHELQLVFCWHEAGAEAAEQVGYILLLAITPGIPALVGEHAAQQGVYAVHGGQFQLIGCAALHQDGQQLTHILLVALKLLDVLKPVQHPPVAGRT